MSSDLYNDHFGFRERPFSLSPDPDFLFWTKAHSRALSVLKYGIESRGPITVVSGGVGTGKTTLIKELLRSINSDVTTGLISNARGDREDLIRLVLNAYDVDAPDNLGYVPLFQRFQDFVIDEYAAGRLVAIVVDEAQNLEVETLEELRILTNINSGKDDMLQVILVGQPELRDMIRQSALVQFAQRVAVTYHLEPMDLDTTIKYVKHRLTHVGGTGEEFTFEAIRHIYSEAEGIPRVINKLCDLSLVYASSGAEKKVDVATIKELIRDGLFMKPLPEPFLLTNRIASAGKAAE